MSLVLTGVRVLDFGRFVAGPFCAALLADYGADVIRIDRPGGGEDRYLMPVTEAGEGALFLQVNRNKRSITLDIDKPEGREVVKRLVRGADVVIANMPPGTLKKVGLDYPTLKEIRHDIILTASSAFGADEQNVNRLGFDGIGQAMSGAVFMSGLPEQPTKAMVPFVDFSTALASALGTMAALFERQRSGVGQVVETSLMRTALNIGSGALIEEAILEIGREPTGNRSPIAGPSDIFRTSDGWIIVQVIGHYLFKRWSEVIGRPELVDDPSFKDDLTRGKNGAALSAIMSEWCASRTTEEAIATLSKARIPAGPVLSPRQVLDADKAQPSGHFSHVDYPGLPRNAPLVSSPASLSRTPPSIRSRAPTLGEHTWEVLLEEGYTREEIEALERGGII